MSPLRGCLVLITTLLLALGHLAWSERAVAAEKTAPIEKQPVVMDLRGDPLPPNAVARLGTVRWRQTDRVSCVAFAPDGKVLASGSGDGRIHLWEVATGKEILRFRGHVNEVQALAFSPDGKVLAADGLDYTTRLWDVATGRELHRLQGGSGCLAFSPDGKVLASMVVDETAYDRMIIYLWDPVTGKELHQLPCGRATVSSIAFFPDGKTLAAGQGDGLSAAGNDPNSRNDRRKSRAGVRLWDVATGKDRGTLGAQQPDVCSVAFCPDGKVLAVGGYDKRIRLWEVATGKELGQFDAADPAGRSPEILRQLGSGVRLALSADGKTLVSACEDRTVLFWEVERGNLTRRHAIQAYCRSLALSPDGRLLAAASSGLTVPLWDVATGQTLHQSAGHGGMVWSFAFSPDGKALATAAGDIRLWEPATGKELRRLPGCVVVAFSPDGKVIACGSPDYTLRLCDAATGQERHRLPASHAGFTKPTAVAFSPDGKLVATESSRSLGLWAVDTGKPSDAVTKEELAELSQHLRDQLNDLAFSPDGKLLVWAAEHAELCLWQMGLDKACRKLEQYGVKSIAFSPDGKLLVAAGGSHPTTREPVPIRVWEVATGREYQRLAETPDDLRTVAFSPNGKTLAAGGGDGTVRLWEMATGKERLRFHGHRGPVRCVVFSPDGTTLASGSEDTTILIWGVTGRHQYGKQQGAALRPEELEALWADLAGADAIKAYRAILTLAAAPAQAVALLGKRLHVMDPADAPRLGRLIAELDDDRFVMRERASRELETLGWAAEPALRRALAGAPSVELRQRAEALLSRLRVGTPSPEHLRALRAVEVLELTGSPEGRLVLDRLAKEIPAATLSGEAKAALERLGRPAAVSP